MTSIEVEVLAWHKHQPRKDIKHPTWFAVSNHILDDAKLFDLTDSEWKALLYVFCQASQQNSANVKLNLAHAKRVCDLPVKVLQSALDKLENAGVTRTLRGRDANGTQPLRDIQTDKQTIQTNNIAQSGDFASFWVRYPRKVGKGKTEAAYHHAIRAGFSHEDLARALDAYLAHLKREGTEAKFVKHGSTFMTSWRDWLDADAGSSISLASNQSMSEAEYDEKIKQILGGNK